MSNKTVACVIARTVSTRLPLKVLRNVAGEHSMLDYIIQRLKRVKNIDEIYLCTSSEPVDDILEDVARNNNIKLYRGASDAVIERLIEVGIKEGADSLIRITGDNVFTSYEYLEEQIDIHNMNKLDYSRLTGVPVGATAELMKLSALVNCYELIDPAISEYLLLFMFVPDKYKCGVIEVNGIKPSSNYTLTVDTPNDLERTKRIFSFYTGNPLDIELKEIIEIVDKNTISNSKFKGEGMVKMPYGKEISFKEFTEDMKNRSEASFYFSVGKK